MGILEYLRMVGVRQHKKRGQQLSSRPQTPTSRTSATAVSLEQWKFDPRTHPATCVTQGSNPPPRGSKIGRKSPICTGASGLAGDHPLPFQLSDGEMRPGWWAAIQPQFESDLEDPLPIIGHARVADSIRHGHSGHARAGSICFLLRGGQEKWEKRRTHSRISLPCCEF